MAAEMDLNLLRVFDALLDTGSVSAAAERLHLSIPATSRALGRLRQAMNDPILVRAGRGLVPTPFALRHATQVRTLLDTAATLHHDTGGDEPSSWRRSISIRANDVLVPLLTPVLLRAIGSDAPGVTVRLVPQDSKEPDRLRDGTLDLDLGVIAAPPPPDVIAEGLFTDHFVALVAAESTLGRRSHLSIDDLCAYPHIAASRRGRDRGPLDDELARIGRSRRVVAVVPSYVTAALLALEPDVICLLPNVLAQHLVDRGLPLRLHEPPVPLPSNTVELRWHRRLDDDPPTRWVREQIRIAFISIGDAPR